jgi:hypothetical protein
MLELVPVVLTWLLFILEFLIFYLAMLWDISDNGYEMNYSIPFIIISCPTLKFNLNFFSLVCLKSLIICQNNSCIYCWVYEIDWLVSFAIAAKFNYISGFVKLSIFWCYLSWASVLASLTTLSHALCNSELG